VPGVVGVYVLMYSEDMAGKKSQKQAIRKPRQRFEPDVIYPFWANAGGNVTRAMQLAADAGETRVPKKPHHWAKYATEFGFSDRLKAEETAKWEAYSKEREAKQQHVLDQIAHSFEEMSDTFLKTLVLDLAVARSEDKDAAGVALKRLNKLFGSMDAVDKFFRMYLRARGQPEKISRNINEQTELPIGYGELETQPPKATSPEDARKMVENQS
jgi:hypothetical protein